MTASGSVAQALRSKLEAAFAPVALVIEDESSRHAGHSGEREGGESHFRIRIVSAAFQGLSRVERQRRVYAAVAEEFAGGLHALALSTLTPEEAGGS
jgi:BolA family transcriptional regulator, general stress-responsive regulator